MEIALEWILSNWRAVTEVTILALSIYVLLRFIQQARGHSILRGLLLVGIAYFVTLYFASKWLELSNINWIMDRFIPLFLVTILVVFQPEVRHALLRIGHENRFSQMFARKRSQLIKTLVPNHPILNPSPDYLIKKHSLAIVLESRKDSKVETEDTAVGKES